jgi:hypothetical protein
MKKLNILFINCFLLIISLPFFFMDRKNTISKHENRNLAAFPHFFTSDGRFDRPIIGNFPQAVDNYINDRFGFRSMFVSLANSLNKSTKKINGSVIIGKDGWLFYSSASDNIRDFFKINLFTEPEVRLFIDHIIKRYEWCKDNGIEFVFLIAPNKHNVYPEYYPFERPKGITRTGQIMAALPEHLKDVVVYPLDYLLQNKTGELPLYFETDTHWNMAGAYCAFEVLSYRVKQLFPENHFPAPDFVTDVRYDSPGGGDIPPMSGFASYGKRTVPGMRPVNGWESYFHYTKNEGVNGIIVNNNDQSLPKAIVFRDSFFNALQPFTSTLFSSTEYKKLWQWFNEQEKEYILENKPDIIIWEIVERSIAGIPYSEWK